VRAGAGRRIAEKRRGRRSTTRSRNCPDLAGVLAISGPMGSECWLARQTCAGDDNRCQVARSQIGLASEISRFWGSYVNPSSGRRPSGAGSRGQQAPELDDARPWRRGQPGTSAAGEACARYYVHSTGLQVTTLYSIAYSVKGQQCRRGGGFVHREGIVSGARWVQVRYGGILPSICVSLRENVQASLEVDCCLPRLGVDRRVVACKSHASKAAHIRLTYRVDGAPKPR
jgi:hypothetical protein